MIKQHGNRRERKPPSGSAEGPRSCKTHHRGNQPYDRAQRQRPNDQGYEIRRLFKCSLNLIGLQQCKKTRTHQLLLCQYHRVRNSVKTNWIPPASAVWFINFNLTSHELSLEYHRLQPHGVSVSAYFARKTELELKLKLDAAEADGICDRLSAMHLGSS